MKRLTAKLSPLSRDGKQASFVSVPVKIEQELAPGTYVIHLTIEMEKAVRCFLVQPQGPDQFQWYGQEMDNLQAAVDQEVAEGRVGEVVNP